MKLINKDKNIILDNYLKTNSSQKIKDFKPYIYQKEVAEAILNGDNVILQAPTGAGKTLSSIMPFIIANEEDYNFPKKLIYSTPRRTLVNSLYNDISKEIKRGKFNNDYEVTIQTGERKEDKYFNGDIVFTTFDQSLSSALSMPISLSDRLGNINVAAVLSSYLIFDEFHLFDPSGAYTTTVLLLNKLKEITPFCIMTATLSHKRTNDLAEKLDAKVIRADKEEYLQDIITQKGKKRKINVSNKTLDAEKIIKLHKEIDNGRKSKKSIVMCNRVDNSQKIFSEINDKIKEQKEDIDVLLIHSRFLDKDRSNKEDEIKELFKKDNTNSNVILISTQVIEVGIDITSDIMHTEISSIDSFLQRIGRCARYQNEKGDIYVYDVLNEGDSKYLPYNEKVTLKTFEYLKEIHGEILTQKKSQNIIDNIYSKDTNIDKEIKEQMNITSNEFIMKSWQKPDKKRYSDLIRNVVGCNIIIRKWIVDGDSPYNYQSLNISPWTLKGKVGKIESATNSWLIKKVIERNDDSEYKYTYKKIGAKDVFANETYLLNPDYFAYDEKIGLIFNEIGTENQFKHLPKNQQEDTYNDNYKEESYLEHINRMKNEIFNLKKELKYLIEYIQIKFELSDEQVQDIIELTIWAHDLGKLSESWQDAHQREKNNFIAHAKRLKKPPPHSAEGFWISLDILESYIIDYLNKDKYIVDVIAKSIVSHHSLNVNKVDHYKLSNEIKDYLQDISVNFFSNKDFEKFVNKNINKLYLILAEGEEITNLSEEIRLKDITNNHIFYFLLVRILRLADQRATKKLNE